MKKGRGGADGFTKKHMMELEERERQRLGSIKVTEKKHAEDATHATFDRLQWGGGQATCVDAVGLLWQTLGAWFD